MKRKKVIKIILVIVLVIVVLFLANLIRKAVIINKFSEKLNEYQSITNFYAKYQIENGNTIESWRKDNITIQKTMTSDNEINMMYANPNEIWMIMDKKETGKLATKMKNETEHNWSNGVVLEDGTLYADNFWDALLVALGCRISTETVNGQECYKLYFQEEFQVFVNKENLLKIKEINMDNVKYLIQYEINTLTDEDVALPSLDGYKIQASN